MKKMLTNIFRGHQVCHFSSSKRILLILGFLFSLINLADAQVTGKVFQDFNANGQIGTADFGLAGVTVKAFNAAGTQVGTTQLTDANGNYSIAVPAGTAVRIEFSAFPTGVYSGPYGTASGTAVQFTTGGTSSVNLGVNDPNNYCQDNPKVLTPVWTNGNPLGGGSAGTTCALFQYNYNDNGATNNPIGTGPNATCASLNNKVGALYGVSYQKSTNTAFTSAVLRRHAGFGPLGIGGIYITTNANSNTPVTSNYVNVNNLGINLGTDPHTGLPADKLVPNTDPNAFCAVGKRGIGDMDISDDGTKLYIVNLFERKIHEINIGNPYVAGSSLTSANVRSWAIPNPGCSNGDFVPWGLKFYKGKLFVGIACTAESSQNFADLRGSVYELNPISGVFTNVISGGTFDNQYRSFQPWNCSIINDAGRQEAIVSDIEFDEKGNMTLGIMTNISLKWGRQNSPPNGGNLVDGYASGNIHKLCYNATANNFTIENNAVVCGVTGINPNNGQGPGGGEFYDDLGPLYPHNESAFGALAIRPGSGEVLWTGQDPVNYYSGGVFHNSTITGAQLPVVYELYQSEDVSTFGKAGGLGDIEVLCNIAPLEIGNRVWMDSDNDGIQDANEMGLANVTVQLYKNGALVGTTTTSSTGQYIFNNSNVTGGLLANMAYEIRIPNYAGQASLSGKNLTTTNVNGNAEDQRDSDGSVSGTNIIIAITTGIAGDNNHTYDIGFKSCAATVNAGSDVGICQFLSTTLTATGANGISPYVYNWDNGLGSGQSKTVSPSVTTTYTVTVTDANNCTSTDQVIVTVYPNPTVNAGADVAVCSGGSVNLTSNGSGGTSPYTYSWTGGGTTQVISVNPTITTTYSVTIVDSRGCSSADQVTVNVILRPLVDAGFDRSICPGSSINISATGSNGTQPYTYTWNNGLGVGQSKSVSPVISTTYIVTITDQNGCTNTDAIVVSMKNCGTTTTTCTCLNYYKSTTRSNNSTQFNFWQTAIGETPDHLINFENYSSGTNLHNVSNLGPLGLKLENLDFTGTNALNAIDDIASSPPIGNIGVRVNDGTRCSYCGDRVRISFSTPVSYIGWYMIDHDGDEWDLTINYSDGTSCAITNLDPVPENCQCEEFIGIRAQKCKYISSIIITPGVSSKWGFDNLYYGTVTCDVSVNNVSSCSGKPATLTATGGGTYLWNNGSTTASITVNPLITTTYTVTVSESPGCSVVRSGTVTVNPNPSVSTSKVDATCGLSNGSATVNPTGGTPGYTYLWSTNATTQSITNRPAGTYTVTVTDTRGCTGSASVTINNTNGGTVNAGADRSICTGSSTTLSATGSGGTTPYTYAWNNGAGNGQTVTVSPGTTTTYTVTMTDNIGCQATDQVVVTVNARPTANAGADVSICSGSSTNLTANGSGTLSPYTYLWSTNQTTQTITVTPTGNTTYTVTVTDSRGCTNTDQVTVTVNPRPTATISKVDAKCGLANGSATANPTGGTPGYTYLWTTNATTQTINNLSAGNYTVTVTDTRGCTGVATITINNTNGATVSAGIDQAICNGTSANLTATPNGGTAPYQYAWSNGAGNTQTVNVSPGTTTTYTVTLTDNLGCIATDQVIVTVNPKPAVTISKNDAKCGLANGSATANPTGGTSPYTYAWTNGGNTQTISNIAAGSYTVTVTDSKGCTGVATITVGNIASPTVNAGADATICLGISANLTAAPSGGTAPFTYAWSNGAGSTQTVTVTPTGSTTYTVTVTDANNCTATDNVIVNVNPKPTVNAGSDNGICIGSSTTLVATGAGGTPTYTYTWNNPASSGAQKLVTPTTTTTYTVTVVDINGCTNTDQVIVTVNPKPNVVTSANIAICTGSSTNISANANGGLAPYVYNWDNNIGSGQTISVSPIITTTYTVTVVDANGCTNTDNVVVTVNSKPSSGIRAPNTVCALEGATFEAFPPVVGATYNWNTNGGTPATSTLDNITVVYPTSLIGTTRNVNLTVTDANGCSSVYTHAINVTQNPVANAGPDKEICEGGSTQIGGSPAGPTGSTFFWTPNAFLNSQTVANPIAFPPVTTTYTLTTTINGCTKSDQITVIVNTLLNPIASATADPSRICTGKSTTLTGSAQPNGGAGAPFAFVWSNSLGSGAIKTATPPATTNYIVTVTDRAGCTDTASVRVQVDPCGSIGDYVWVDTDGDGVQDPTEIGLNGVTVLLKDALGNTLATTVTTTGLLGPGYYNFPDLFANTYRVMFMSPTGYVLTDDNSATSNDNNDSDADPTTGTTAIINLAAGQIVTNVDAGLYQPASIGNYVWEDLDKDGIQEPGEPGINGVTVLLKNVGGIVLQTTVTTTNAGTAGYYQFTNLAPGDYIVMFMTPTGYNETTPNTTADNNDSDADPTTGNSPVTNLVSGESDQTVDAGIYRPATIGDYVWRDTDGDGVQDPTEAGINGVTVLLKDAGGNVLQTTVTTTNAGLPGYYQFTVDPGTYVVMFMAPAGNTLSPTGAGTTGTDSDPNPLTGNSNPVTVTSGGTNQTIDAGLYQPASLGNYVWEDLDKDGIQEAGEPGVNGVTVLLKNASGITLQSTVTATNAGLAGYYQFTNLAPGDYIVMFMTPAGYNETTPNTTADGSDSDADPTTGNAPLTNLVSGESDQTIDAGIYRPAIIGDYVWNDTDGDGVQDPTETGLNGVTVLLKDATTLAVLQTTVTTTGPSGTAGYYSFSVDPGTYVVMFMTPTGGVLSPTGNGTTTTDSDPNPTTGNSTPITVVSGGTNTTIDAGIYQPASIGNYVWEDLNKNGIQEAGEPGVNGVTVLLKNAVGTVLQTTVTTTNAGTAGYYQFTNLAPGDYMVMFMTPTGYNETTPNTTADNNDSDADPATGNAPLTNLVSGESDQTIDAGIYRPATIGDYVWRDRDGDGVQDPTEAGMNGVTVLLKDPTTLAVLQTTVTTTGPSGNAGYYSFTVEPGSYVVMFMAPTGSSLSPTGNGTTSTDSDPNPLTGNTNTVVVTSGSTITTIDAGMKCNATVSAGSDVAVCSGSSATLLATASNGVSPYQFAWNNPASVGSTKIVSPSLTTTYTVTVTDNVGCSATDQVIVTVNLNPTVNAGVDQSICLGYSANLSATGNSGLAPYTFNWDNGLGLGQTKSVNPITTTTYTVTITDANGCSNTDQVVVRVNQNPVVNAGIDQTQCPSTPTSLTANANGGLAPYTFSWDNGLGLGQTKTVSPTTTTTYNVTVTDANGCTNTDQVQIIVIQCGALGNYVWEDLDGDGVQDAGEPGINGVTVILKDGLGFPIPGKVLVTSTNLTTGQAGYYQFTNLPAGSYIVMFMTPTGYTLTDQNSPTGTAATNSDPNPTTGNTAVINLGAGETNNDVDAGLTKPASIGDYVWRDSDGDGVQDPTETGLNGVTVLLKDATTLTVLQTTVTTTGGPLTSPGYYTFNVEPGTYVVMFMAPAGNTLSPTGNGTVGTDSNPNPTTGNTAPIVVTSGSTNTTIDAGLYQPASLGNYVWFDEDKDGVQDANEVGIDGFVVNLYNAAGVLQASTTTIQNPNDGSHGYYQFTNLAPGAYYVQIVPTAGLGYTSTIPNNQPLANEATDSDVNGLHGVNTTSDVTLVSGQNYPDLDAGFYLNNAIGNFVWNDINKNGIQDLGESGINGITVTLYSSTGAVIEQMITTNTPGTGQAGWYQFDNLLPGNYYVKFDVPTGYYATLPNTTGEATDSDLTGTNGTGTTALINVTAGTVNNDVDAGIYRAVKIGNYVWNDTGADNLGQSLEAFNGIQDPGELPQTNLTVTLKNLAGITVQTTTTDSKGEYCFFVEPNSGSYYVEFALPSGFGFTSANVLANTLDATDSDVTKTFGEGTTTAFTVGTVDNLTIDAGIYLLVLPLELLEFEAEYVNKNANLTWSTTNEVNSDKFIIERRYESESNFTQIGNVKANNVASAINEYSFVDQTINKDGKYYYRLKVLDFDKRFKYSNIRTIDVNTGSAIDVIAMPNPARDILNVQITGNKLNVVKYELIDLYGRVIISQTESLSSSNSIHNVKIDVSNFKSGTYFLRMNMKNKTLTEKITITH